MKLYACIECGKPSVNERCDAHMLRHATELKQNEFDRGTASDRGYDRHWRQNRGRFLAVNKTCIDCGRPANVADHDPLSRKELLAKGDPHPDAWKHLKPRCKSCHSRRTGVAQPGGWNLLR